MDSRLSFLLLVLVISCVSTNARSLVTLDDFVVQMDNKVQNESNIGRNEQFCTQCEEYTSQCISLVDHYAPLFFLEVSTITPEQLCEKANLCGETALVNLPKSSDFCTVCHNIVKEILTKLEDPDTQLEVIKMLMKGCEEVGSYVQQCKKLVLQYVPPILIDAEKFLETTDVCTAIHACKNSEDHITSTLADM
ncbi:Saposin-like type B, region 1 [Musa troglodytarum]|uniref:Pulmonary surfactant-associated protein B n=1 Tax=Musa troglodytarum TaxID=320322 RepID=A0A9E7HK94_9LILI|nr:Saposin-like type B, region 1 [Musa troglodytarum]